MILNKIIILSMILSFGAGSLAQAGSSFAVCQIVLSMMEQKVFLNQNDLRLKQAGLFAHDGRSRICTVGCAAFIDQTLRGLIAQRSGLGVTILPDSKDLYLIFENLFNSQMKRDQDPTREAGAAPYTIALGLKKYFASMAGNLISVTYIANEKFFGDNDKRLPDDYRRNLSVNDLMGDGKSIRLTSLAAYYFDNKMQIKWGHQLYGYYFDLQTQLLYVIDPNKPNYLHAAHVNYLTWKNKQYLELRFDPGTSPSFSKIPKDGHILIPHIIAIDIKPSLKTALGL